MIRSELKLGAVAALALGLSLPAAAGPINGLVVFGDSLADSGNVSLATGGAIPDPAFYFNGRFSNGPVYAEFIADALGVPLLPSLAGGTNFAFGGARTGMRTDASQPLWLMDQVDAYFFATGGVADPSVLYTVFGGGNDLRDASDPSLGLDPIAVALTAAANIGDIVGELIAAGARNILVPNLPDIGRSPEAQARGPEAAAAGRALAELFNSRLLAELAPFAGSMDTNLILFDTFALSDFVNDNPGLFGLTNLTGSCLDVATGTICADPDQYAFWDPIHPSAVVHRIFGEAMAGAVIPEPATLFLLLAGLAGLGAARQRAG